MKVYIANGQTVGQVRKEIRIKKRLPLEDQNIHELFHRIWSPSTRVHFFKVMMGKRGPHHRVKGLVNKWDAIKDPRGQRIFSTYPIPERFR